MQGVCVIVWEGVLGVGLGWGWGFDAPAHPYMARQIDEQGRGGVNRRRRKKFSMCESIGHRPLQKLMWHNQDCKSLHSGNGLTQSSSVSWNSSLISAWVRTLTFSKKWQDSRDCSLIFLALRIVELNHTKWKGRCPVGHRREFRDVRPSVRPSVHPSPPLAIGSSSLQSQAWFWPSEPSN